MALKEPDQTSVWRQIRKRLKLGEISPDDAEFLRDAVISTRELVDSIIPAMTHAVDMANARFSRDFPDNSRGVGCVSTALITVFGPEADSPSNPVGYLRGGDGPTFTQAVSEAANDLGLSHETPTSCHEFVSLMEDDRTVGAIITQKLSTTEGHMIGVRPVTTAIGSDNLGVPLTNIGLLEEAENIGQGFAVTNTLFPPPITKYCNQEGLTALYHSSLDQKPGAGPRIVVFQRPKISV